MTTSTAHRTTRHCRLCRPPQEPNDYTLLLRQWMRSPARMGAIAPSSRHLAEAVCTAVPERGEPVVVELGAGTGPFTAEIQRRLGGRGRHLAVEIDPLLAQRLRHRHPGAEVIQRDAVHLRHLLDERGIESADMVVSGLPWALFPTPTRHQLMDATAAVLAPAGAFTAFTYLHAVPLTPARRFRDLLADRFEEVVPSRTIWRNTTPGLRPPRPQTRP